MENIHLHRLHLNIRFGSAISHRFFDKKGTVLSVDPNTQTASVRWLNGPIEEVKYQEIELINQLHR